MATIIPFIKFKPLENIKCVGFPSIDGCITNIETVKPDIDIDDFENDYSELGCQLEDGRWIIIRWIHGEDSSEAYPAYYSSLWNSPITISTSRIEYELSRVASSNVDYVKNQVRQWIPYLADEYRYLADAVSKIINGETK